MPIVNKCDEDGNEMLFDKILTCHACGKVKAFKSFTNPPENKICKACESMNIAAHRMHSIKKSENEKDKTSAITFFADEVKKVIGEQIYDPLTKQFSFAVNDGKELKYYSQYENYVPLNNEAITKGCVCLPAKAEPYENNKVLIDEIQAFIHKYLDVTPEFEKFATWYVLLSWVYDRLNTIPYLRALGDTGTGKSRFLDVIARLCYKSIMVAGALNPAPLFRLIEQFKGTLIVDEADLNDANNKSDETSSIIKIFNCGFEKSKPVVRCNQNDANELNFFDVYCPKVLATRQRFKDQATESRCLTEEMRQTTRKDIPTLLLKDFTNEQQKLRNKLLMFRLTNYFDFEQRTLVLQEMNIEPRLKQAFEAFATLFSNMPEVLELFKEFLINYQKEIIEERAMSFDGQIVNYLFEFIDAGQMEISSNDIAEKMGGDIRPTTITRRLKVIGIKNKLVRTNKVKRILDLENKELIALLKKRYVSENSNSVTDVTLVTDVTGTPPTPEVLHIV